jgi:biopolymer transport protein ExbD
LVKTVFDPLKRPTTVGAGSHHDRNVLLRADAPTPHQAVVTALDALGQLGFRRISIGTAPEPRH